MGSSNTKSADGPTERSPLVPAAGTVDPVLAGEEQQNHEITTEKERSVSGLRAMSIIISMGCLIFLQTCNVSLLTTIQSAIAEDLQAYAQVSWLNSAYLIPMASVPAIAGRLCQLFPPQRYMLVSSFVFITGLIVTASAPNYSAFLAGRAICGFGAAGNFPVSIIVIIDLTSLKRRGVFMGLLNSGFTFGLAMGAVIAGGLEPVVGWRTIFWIQIPVAFVAGTCVFFAIPAARPDEYKIMRQWPVAKKLASIDYLGALTLILTVTLLLFGLGSNPITVTPILLSAISLATFLLIELRLASTPIIPISILRSRATLLTCLATLGIMMARYIVILYTPMYFIGVRSWSQATAGTSLICVNGGFAIGGLLVGWIHIRRAGSFYLANLSTIILFIVTIGVISAIAGPTMSVPLFMIVVFCNGFVTGACLNYTLVHLLHLVPAADHSIATSVTAMFRGFGGSFGSAIGGGIFARVLRTSLEAEFAKRGMDGEEDLVDKLLGSPRLVATLDGAEKAVAVAGYVTAIKAIFAAGALLALAAVVVQAGTGWTAPKENRTEEELDEEAEDVLGEAR